MIITSALIGFVIAGMSACFEMENGKSKKIAIRHNIIIALILFVLCYGFFCGIKGLCPYLPTR